MSVHKEEKNWLGRQHQRKRRQGAKRRASQEESVSRRKHKRNMTTRRNSWERQAKHNADCARSRIAQGEETRT